VLVLFWRTVLLLIREKQLSEHTTDFLNNMTHEFKTPLTNIALAGKMIVKDTASKQEGKIKHYSEIILEENEKLRLQVEQVLSMTALERGEIPLLKTELNFNALITDCVKSISIQIENKQGDLKLNLKAEHPVVMGDKTHLINALSNLIDNAIKYSKEKPELLIETFNRGGNLIIKISDKGIGIEKEYQQKVFDKFFRVPTGDVHNVKGFGLGLAYIKKIIELHQGTIELASETGKGTTFTITLPNA
jgi:two-component system phosphate regulon sensor histidine kinase PhoR